MGTFPINLLAPLADVEFIVEFASFWFKPVEDFVLCYSSKPAAAAKTASPGLDLIVQLVAVQDIP